VFTEIKNRGVQDVCIAVCDDLEGLPQAITTTWEFAGIGVSDTPGVAVADSGYWHEQQIDEVLNTGTQVLIPPDAGKPTTASCLRLAREPERGRVFA
jgi:hypothetical protein